MKQFEREKAHFFHTYKRLPLEIDRGRGMIIRTTDGKRYLDMFSGLAVNALGYGNLAVLKAIRLQAARYIHLSNYYLQEPQIRLAELLTRQTGFPRVFFCNSGTEAIEGAIKIARRWGSLSAKREIVSFTNAFHGRTMGALSLMDRPRYRNGFEPFLKNCSVVQFNDERRLQNAIGRSTAAVVVEFIQGEGGVRPVTPEFARTLNALHQEYGFLLVADEIQSGLGRTGKFFGFEHFAATPDLVVLAKPVGGGLPLGVILGSAAVATVLEPGMHGTTFGGNPVACAAGVAVLTEITRRRLVQNAASMGAHLLNGLQTVKAEFPSLVKEVRGFGLMVGMELTQECEPFVTAMREKRILINGTDGTVLRFLPPYIVTRREIGATLRALREVFHSRTKAGASDRR